MLMNTFEIGAAIVSLVCMFHTIVCIVFGKKGSRVPTFFALTSCAFYMMFLALARHNMDMFEQQMFSSLLFGFAFSAVVAECSYREAKKEKRAIFNEKIAEFKHNCSEARRSSGVMDAEFVAIN